jgi:hydroxyacylglutathione hydrolase
VLFERIESRGISHYSYLVGDGNEALVIDPRRDCDLYVELAQHAGMRIAHILETHRNEDYVVGSLELATRTGAEIWHADGQLDYRYGRAAEPGQTWQLGSYSIAALPTPGHTAGSLSYVLHEADGSPYAVFTGDALFAGDVGRVDFLGSDRVEEMARTLYETLQRRLLPLGDEVIVCPAHGSGSVCAAAISSRPVTTIGIERRHNPKLLVKDEEEFVAAHARDLPKAPYFRRMEVLNVEGAPILGSLPAPPPLSAAAFEQRAADALVVDTRMELGFSAGHVPGAVSLPSEILPAFAGWILPYETPLLLVNETASPDETVRALIRLGFDDLDGSLAGGMLAWHTSARASQSVATITVEELCRRLDDREKLTLLDVRTNEEIAGGEIEGAVHIDLAEVGERGRELAAGRPVYVFCGAGLRSMIAASLLQRQGLEDITVALGGLAAWRSSACPIRS